MCATSDFCNQAVEQTANSEHINVPLAVAKDGTRNSPLVKNNHQVAAARGQAQGDTFLTFTDRGVP